MDAIKQVLSQARNVDICPPPVSAHNFAQVLRERTRIQPDELAYVFLGFGRTPDLIRTYREVDARARGVAKVLTDRGLAGRNIVLAFPSARDFAEVFFGCLYAGCVAVPALPPDDERERKRLIGIVRDCDPGMVLTVGSELDGLRDYFATTDVVMPECLAADRIPPCDEAVDVAGVPPDHVAFLQYTSGSTAEPKGVMVTHGNLLHNEEVITLNLRAREQRWLSCSWLPHYHDMGLIGGLLHPFYIGRPVVLYATTDFLQHPMRWLKIISDLGVSMSGAPNFAYDLCVKRSKRFDVTQLDLRDWRVAFNGAEPVRDETLRKFGERFGPCGFSETAMIPCYGLAEGTLMVTSHRPGERLVRIEADYDRLAQGVYAPASGAGPSVTLVGNGLVSRSGGQDIRLIDARSGHEVSSGRVGEICVRGGSVCRGYFRRPELSEEIFNAYADETGACGFMRTGDLGFVGDTGQLFVTGRLKDVVIWNGANYYPQDIEQVIEDACDQIRGGRIAAFNVKLGNTVSVLAVGELSLASISGEIAETMAQGIRDAVWTRMGIQLAAVVFISKGSMPRTSSGKIRRSECRNRYLNGRFDVLHEWCNPLYRESLDSLLQRADRAAVASLVV